MVQPELVSAFDIAPEAAEDSVRSSAGGGRSKHGRPEPHSISDISGFRGPIAAGHIRSLISRRWFHMAAIFPTAMLFASFFAGLPPLRTMLSVAAASLFALGAVYLVRMRNRAAQSAWQSWLVGITTVCVPMGMFGLGMGFWCFRAGIPPEGPFGGFLFASVIATLIQSGKRYTLFSVATVGLAGLFAWEHPPALFVVLLALLPVALLIDRAQVAVQRGSFMRREAELRLSRRAEEILRDFEESGQGWFWETDHKGELTYLSSMIAQLYGADRQQILGSWFGKLFDSGREVRDRQRTLAFHLSTRSAFHELAVKASIRGEDRWWSISGKPLYDSAGNYLGFRGAGHDLTETRRTQQEVTRLARYDSLTGLANRFQMAQTLEKLLEAPNESDRQCTVFLLDLDRFKQVNDTLGHPAGDILLKQVAQRLLRVIGERGVVGRLGGDEFQIVFAGTQDRGDLANLAHRVIESLSQPYSIEGNQVVIGTSVGIARAPDDGSSSESIMRNADLALYAAKDAGRGCYRFYAIDLHARAEEKRQLEQDLRDAIHAGALELYYQPVIETATEQISGFEALMRWNHPAKGMLSPSEFVEVAEDTGLIAAMGEWAIRTACHDLTRWPDSIRVAVNVSALQFANPQLPSIVTSAIAQAGIDPERLELEITESVFLTDHQHTDTTIAALKRIGVRLVLDDFGTGYSSLSYLKKVPFDKIKIDQGFVRGATQKGSRNGAIITSITSLAQSLGMDTTAEGVETLDELELVRLLGCSHVQGYVYDRPFSAEKASQRLESGLKAIASGPRASRALRQDILRKVVLDHEGQAYTGTICNISTNGAMIEGLWNVPSGTIFKIAVSDDLMLVGKSRWSEENRMGIEFETPIQLDRGRRISLKRDASPQADILASQAM
jgi:diguanylate cyclase (GGDEF)-like protein/PAS domain S-box-containing protein